MSVVGILLLLSAGPFDFLWYSKFGLDGLMSPPHMFLIIGMMITSIGGMAGLVRYNILSGNNQFLSNSLLIIGLLPIWLSCSGMISSLSLPFSQTDFFNFNPEPFTAVVVATTGYPFLISLFLIMSSVLSKNRFGTLSILGGLFLLIYGSTAILPNFAIADTVLFYSTNMIPLLMSDYIISKLTYRPSSYIAAGMLGASFFMFYYPYIMYTYNEILLGKLVSPSLIYAVYFELIHKVFLITLVPAILSAFLGCYFSKRICRKLRV